MLVARAGKIVLEDSYGLADLEAQTAVADDAIVRIYSMTKPITCVAALMCYEKNCFQLDDPVLQDIKEDLLGLDIDRLTPVDALLKLHEIRKRVGG